jgi:phosphoglycolate phosphatase
MKKLIIYDLDGTLVDTREDIFRGVNHMLKELGRPPISNDEIAGYVGHGLYHLMKKSIQSNDEKMIEKGSKIYRKYYAEHMMDHSCLYPGVLEILDYFAGKKQAVITNKPNPFTVDMLEALGISKYFVEIVAGDSDYPKKPDPAAVLAMMKTEEASADETLFIGDSEIDVQTARNAGVETVVLSHGFTDRSELESAAPLAIVENFDELLRLAKKKGW